MSIVKILRHQEKIYARVLRNITRLFFAALIAFELLNLLSLLKFSLEFTWLGLLITAIAVWSTIEIVAIKYQRKKHHPLHWSIWTIALAGLTLDASGDFFHLYGKFNWWDQLVHLSVSAVVCFTLFIVITAFWIDKFEFSLLFKSGRIKLSLFLAATTTMTFGALYEIEEYLEDVFFDTNRLGPGVDTANDLFLNFLGVSAVIISITIYYLITHKRKILD